MIINIDKYDVEDAIKKGREETLKRELVEAGFHFIEEPPVRDKLSILLNLGCARLAAWYQVWTEVRARIWTRLGLQ